MTKVYQKNLLTSLIRQRKIYMSKDIRYLTIQNSDAIDITLNKYVDRPTIFNIKEYFNKSTESNFSEITPNDIKKEIKSLDSPKKDSKKSQ